MNHTCRILATIAVLLAAATLGCSPGTDTGEGGDTDVTASQGEHGGEGGEHEHEGGEGRSEHDGEHGEEGGGEHDRDGGEHGGEGRGEHDRDEDGHHGEEGEESGDELSLTESYDEVRNGARLILAYDKSSNSFKGTVENTTTKTLERVRVEVHLSNGKELGPTTPADLEPGAKREVQLTATSTDFDGWVAHPEVGSGEHGHGGEHGEEGRGEHDRDGGEHGGEDRGEHDGDGAEHK